MYQAIGISKLYGNATALDNVSMTILPGEVHALLGANGAGKSTLMKILAGAQAPTRGSLRLDGIPIAVSDTLEAARAGIAWVAQELTVYEHLDVLENLFLGREPRIGPVVSRREMRKRAAPYLRMVGLPENQTGPLGALRLGERQRVEICRALLREPRILILDEPTSALDSHETARLFDVLARLRARGVAIVLVSHFLEDVFSIADRVTVLRDGRSIVDGAPIAEVTKRDVIDAMLGERTRVVRQDRGVHFLSDSGADSLTVQSIAISDVLQPCDFTVAPGEIVALAGLEGSGVSAVMRILSGQVRADSGTVTMPGGGGAPRDLADAARRRVAFVPADRARVGIFSEQSVGANIASVRSLALKTGRLFLNGRDQSGRAERRVAELEIAPNRIDIPIGALSGGNQQKVVFAKWLEAEPRTYLLDDPTRGVDVHTRAQMHEVIRALAADGAVVLIASSDLEELCTLADRSIVFFHGRAVGEIPAAQLNPHRLLDAINVGVIDADLTHQ
jgi:ABC-type sugar transport system ATPase subunit